MRRKDIAHQQGDSFAKEFTFATLEHFAKFALEWDGKDQPAAAIIESTHRLAKALISAGIAHSVIR